MCDTIDAAEDADAMTDSDVSVMFITELSGTVEKTRLQKLSLMFDMIYDDKAEEHGAYRCGYSDDIDESAQNLVASGSLKESYAGYSVTDYGKEVLEILKTTDSGKYEDMKKILNAFKRVKDREIVGITYHLYPEYTKNSTIKKSVDALNRRMMINGVKLEKINPKSLIEDIKNGVPLKVTVQ